jgi:hypothetical protein
MPAYTRYQFGVRSDGRGNFRYREATLDELYDALQEQGWCLNRSEGTVVSLTPPGEPEPVEPEEGSANPAQWLSLNGAAFAIVNEQRPFCDHSVRDELVEVCVRGLESGVTYVSPDASYACFREWTGTEHGPAERMVVRRDFADGASLLPPQVGVLSPPNPEANLSPIGGEPSLERLLQAEEAIESALADYERRAETRRQAREAAREARRTHINTLRADPVLVRQLREQTDALRRSASARLTRVEQPAPIGSADNPWPGYDGRLP